MTDERNCRFTSKCKLYPRFKNEFGLKVFKMTYCHSPKHKECERFKLATSGSMPPPDLLPNGRQLAE